MADLKVATNVDTVFTVSFDTDVAGAPNPGTGDGTPDKYQTIFRYASAGNGTVTGQLTLAEAVQNVSVREKQIAVRYGDSAAVYNQVLEEQRRASGVQGARNLVLTEKDRGFLLYSGYCEPLNF